MYNLKTIRTAITLGEGTFDNKNNTVTIEGLATNIRCTKPGGNDKPKCSIEITGLDIKKMEQLTTLAFLPLTTKKNVVSVLAGEQGQALNLVFKGEIASSFANFENAPDVVFQIEAITGSYPDQIAASPVAINGQVSIDALFGQFAVEAGYVLQNDGVTGSVANTIINGSPIEKLHKLAKQVGCELIIDDGTVIIFPNGGKRSGNTPLVTKDTGLIGYPTFTNDGVQFKSLYSPAFRLGGLVQLQSIVPKATGIWKITKLEHALSAYVSNDANWFSEITGQWVNGLTS